MLLQTPTSPLFTAALAKKTEAKPNKGGNPVEVPKLLPKDNPKTKKGVKKPKKESKPKKDAGDDGADDATTQSDRARESPSDSHSPAR